MAKKDLSPKARFVLAVVMCCFGCALLAFGALTYPVGEIHDSLCVASGEVFTFAGALIGIDTHYKSKYKHDE